MTIKVTVPNTSSDSLTFGSDNTPTAAQVIGIDSGSSNGQLAFNTTASGTSNERMRITAAGNVGIGTSSPESISNFKFLDVGSSSVNQGVVQANNGTVKTAIYTSGTEGYLATRTSHNLNFQTGGTTRATIDTSGNLLFNSGYGSVATAYGCRAWVNFNGTGTVAIRASGNVSSITDNGVGNYNVNFTTALPDASYAVNAMTTSSDGANGFNGAAIMFGTTALTTGASQMSTSTVRIVSKQIGYTDVDVMSVSVFR